MKTVSLILSTGIRISSNRVFWRCSINNDFQCTYVMRISHKYTWFSDSKLECKKHLCSLFYDQNLVVVFVWLFFSIPGKRWESWTLWFKFLLLRKVTYWFFLWITMSKEVILRNTSVIGISKALIHTIFKKNPQNQEPPLCFTWLLWCLWQRWHIISCVENVHSVLYWRGTFSFTRCGVFYVQSLRFMLECERLQHDGNLAVRNESKLLVRCGLRLLTAYSYLRQVK